MVQPPNDDDRDNLVNDATQKALERFDETMRELALRRYREFESELEPRADAVRRRGDAAADAQGRQSTAWPAGEDERR